MIQQPQSTDYLNSPDHAESHRIVAVDSSSPEQSLVIGANGSAHIKEITTPSAIVNYGAVYAKADNKLYFQDGAGAEHEVRLIDSSTYGEMYLYANTTVTVIDTADVWHTVSLSEITAGALSSLVTYSDGVRGTDITAYATYNGGASTLVTTTAPHNLSAGDFITITGTTNYNNAYEILSTPLSTTFEIDKAWDTNDDGVGTYNRGGALTVNQTGLYKATWNMSLGVEAKDHVFTFAFMINKTACTKCRARVIGPAVGDFVVAAASSFVNITAGDKLSFIAKNIGASGNITIRHANVNIHRL